MSRGKHGEGITTMLKNMPIQRGRPTKNAVSDQLLRVNLGQEAVKMALCADWERAVELNREILKLCPGNCEATNRLAKALMELARYQEAREVLEDLCRRSPANAIARKNLERVNNLETNSPATPRQAAKSSHTTDAFIEQSGKSCVAVLRRPAELGSVCTAGPGDAATLTIKKDNIVVSTSDGTPLGTLQPRLARRLRRLIAAGNSYSAAIINIGNQGTSVIIHESSQHPNLRGVISFPGHFRVFTDLDQTAMQRDVATDTDVLDPDSIAIDGSEQTSDPEPTEAVVAMTPEEFDDDTTVDPDDPIPVLDVDADAAPIPVMLPVHNPDWE